MEYKKLSYYEKLQKFKNTNDYGLSMYHHNNKPIIFVEEYDIIRYCYIPQNEDGIMFSQRYGLFNNMNIHDWEFIFDGIIKTKKLNKKELKIKTNILNAKADKITK